MREKTTQSESALYWATLFIYMECINTIIIMHIANSAQTKLSLNEQDYLYWHAHSPKVDTRSSTFFSLGHLFDKKIHNSFHKCYNVNSQSFDWRYLKKAMYRKCASWLHIWYYYMTSIVNIPFEVKVDICFILW